MVVGARRAYKTRNTICQRMSLGFKQTYPSAYLYYRLLLQSPTVPAPSRREPYLFCTQTVCRGGRIPSVGEHNYGLFVGEAFRLPQAINDRPYNVTEVCVQTESSSNRHFSVRIIILRIIGHRPTM